MFKEQVEGANVPSYGQHGLIKGDLVLSRAEEVVSVHIKVFTASLFHSVSVLIEIRVARRQIGDHARRHWKALGFN